MDSGCSSGLWDSIDLTSRYLGSCGLRLLGLQVRVGVQSRGQEPMQPGKESSHVDVVDRLDESPLATRGCRVDLGDPVQVLDKGQVVLGRDQFDQVLAQKVFAELDLLRGRRQVIQSLDDVALVVFSAGQEVLLRNVKLEKLVIHGVDNRGNQRSH